MRPDGVVLAVHLEPRENPRRSWRGGKRERPAGASLWDFTFSEIIDSGARPHDPAKQEGDQSALSLPGMWTSGRISLSNRLETPLSELTRVESATFGG